jgi:alpha-acetolactate decarboxylase
MKDRANNTKRTVGSHQEMMGALGRASKREPINTERLFAGPEFGRLTPEAHVNVVSEGYHKKWTKAAEPDYDKHAMDETRYKDTMPK